LGILQFAKFRLWKDLDENWESLAGNPLVKHLIETPTAPFIDPVPAATDDKAVDLDALSAQCPVPADSSQLEAVAEAAQGRTFVLEGPPGTGKSQTITNLLAKALADGKRVLFVAEKRAALSVVQRRLEEIGLGPFSLDLHDKGARPAAVRAQVKAALEHRVTMDGAALSTNLEIANSNRRTLSRYAERLHEKNSAGFSLYSARTSELDSTARPAMRYALRKDAPTCNARGTSSGRLVSMPTCCSYALSGMASPPSIAAARSTSSALYP